MRSGRRSLATSCTGPASHRSDRTTTPSAGSRSGTAPTISTSWRYWPRLSNERYRVREACRAAEQRYGLRRTAPADRTAARRPTRAEIEKAKRRGWSEAPRITLRRAVSMAAAGALASDLTLPKLHCRWQPARTIPCRRFTPAERNAIWEPAAHRRGRSQPDTQPRRP